MISRVWHGWTTHANAETYHQLLRTEVLPGIAAKQVPGYHGAHLLRREHEDEVEFITLLWFDSLDSVRAFVGEDYEPALMLARVGNVLVARLANAPVIPFDVARPVADMRFDARSQHYDTLLTPDETR